MMERILFEYLINAVWQLPLLLTAVWLIIRVTRPRLLLQHLLWLTTLALAIVMPLHGFSMAGESRSRAATTSNPAIAPPLEAPLRYAQTSIDSVIVFSAAPQKAARSGVGAFALHTSSIHVSDAVVHWTVACYLVLIALSAAKLVISFIAAMKLRSGGVAQPLTLLESKLFIACAQRLQIPSHRLPTLRTLADPAASPMVIGVRKPVLLLPESFRHTAPRKFNERHLMAILSHELAHVRRRDYLVNLIARAASLPIAWHPATTVIQARIAQTREMICDAHAAGCFDASSTYVRSLLSLAASIVQPQPKVAAVGLFNANRNSLEERIMNLTQPQPTTILPVRLVRIAAGAAILIAATTTAAMLHLRPSAPVVYAAQRIVAQTVTQPAPSVTGESVPPSESITVQTPAAAPTPKAEPTPSPAPDPKPAPKVILRSEDREMTPEERKQFEETMATVREQVRAATSQIDTAKLKREIEAAKLNSLNSPEFQKEIEDLKASIKTINSEEMRKNFARLNSPEFRQQIQELKLNSLELRDQIKFNIPTLVTPNLDAMQTGMVTVHGPDPAFKKRIADACEEMRAQIKQANGDGEQIRRAVDQFVKEVDTATRELVREKTVVLTPTPPAPPKLPAASF